MKTLKIFLFIILAIGVISSCEKSKLPVLTNPNVTDSRDTVSKNTTNNLSCTPGSGKSGDVVVFKFVSSQYVNLTSGSFTPYFGTTVASIVGFYNNADNINKTMEYFISVAVPALSPGNYSVKITIGPSQVEVLNPTQFTVLNSGSKTLYIKNMQLKNLYPDTKYNVKVQLRLWDKEEAKSVALSPEFSLVYTTGVGWSGTANWTFSPSLSIPKYIIDMYEVDLIVDGVYQKSSPMDCSGFSGTTTFGTFYSDNQGDPYSFGFDANFEWK